MLKDQMVS